MILSQFQTVGRVLFSQGLVSSHNGTLSIRLGDRIIITRRGCQLGCFEENDLIETGISKNERSTPLASVELPVHRAIYQKTTASAIIHAHPPHTVALSLTQTEFVPSCAEALATIGQVPILGWNMDVKLGRLAGIITQALTKHRIVIVHGQGSFAMGQLLEEAYNYTTTLEASCQVACLLKSLGTGQTNK